MRNVLSLASAVAMTVAAGVALSGWGSGGTGSTSGVPSRNAPGSSATRSTNSPMRAARGAVGGFGSIIVHGAEYRMRGARLLLPDCSARPIRLDNEADGQKYLALGMVVNLKSDGRGHATEIEYHDTMRGVIGDRGADFLEVLGYRIGVDASTHFSGASGLDDPLLSSGHMVEVSGFVDDQGGLRATYVRSRTGSAGAGQEIKGFVVGPVGGTSFQLGLAPTATQTVTVDFTGLPLPVGIVDGAFVQVRTKGPIAAGILNATAVCLEDEHEPAELEDTRVDGIVTSGDSGQFFLAGAMVQTMESTVFEGMSAGQVAPGARLRVEGTFTGGVLVAAHIQFED